VVVSFTGPNRAVVHSGSGRTYNVSTEQGRYSCECGDFVYRQRRDPSYACRHVRAALIAAGMAAPEAVPIASPLETQRADDAAARAYREEARGAWEEAAATVPGFGEHEVRLTENEAAFQRLMEEARRGPVEYMYSDVLPDRNMTFGVEIEFEGGDREAIARDLYEEGLIAEPRQSPYHAGRLNPNLWAFETDGSVPTGGELVSPVFRDTPTAWQQIEKVCEIVRRHGGRATARCGGHVHIGTESPLDSRNERWRRLLRLVRSYEDVMFRMAAGGTSEGRHRGTGYTTSMRSVREWRQTGHYHAANRRSQTVEFRHFNGTLDPRQIQANVRLAAAVVAAAARDETDSALPEQEMPLGHHARSGREDDHSAVRRFLDTIFTRTRDKLSALWLYATSRWQTA